MTPVIKLQVILVQATLYLLILAAIFDVITSSYQDESSEENTEEQPQREARECGLHTPRGSRGRSKHRIAGGYAALLNEFPSYVHIRPDTSNFCGGTIISERYVLTSAHCLKRTKDAHLPVNISLNAGTVKNFKATMRRTGFLCMAEKFVSFEESDLDVALLMVDPPWEFGAGIEPVCMPSRAVTEKDAAFVVGFGISSSNADKVEKKLRVLPVKKLPNCDFFEESPVLKNRICFASSDNRYRGDACPGDGGGPVYATISGRQSIVGILLGGANTCKMGVSEPSQYLDVYRYQKEIHNLTSMNCTNPGS